MATTSENKAAVEEKTVVAERYTVDEKGSIFGVARLNRPKDMNPLDWDTNLELERVCDEFAADPAVRVIGITGTGKAFSAGGDMIRYQKLLVDPIEFPRFLDDVHRFMTKMGQYPKPIIALINGIAVAGGFETILYCDLAFMAESARIGDYHQTFGMMGGGGVLAYLPVAVGPARARELLFSGRLLSSAEALSWGLVAKVVPDDQLLEAGKAFAAEVSKKSPLAIANAKSVANSGIWSGYQLATAMRVEREVNARYCVTSHDAPEGLRAFAEKRRPVFQGK